MIDEDYLRKIKHIPENPENKEKSHKDYSNGMNILSVINYKVLIKKRHDHPLIYCYYNGDKQNWICDDCFQSYDINVPNFYCSSCNYFLCQKCFLSNKVKEVNLIN